MHELSVFPWIARKDDHPEPGDGTPSDPDPEPD